MVPNGGTLTRERRHAALLDFGDTVAALQGQYITAEDVGTSSRDMSVIAERTEVRRRAAAPARRLGRPEPVHGARRARRDPGLLRPGFRLELAARPQGLRRRARATSARAWRSAAPRTGRSWCSPMSIAASGSSPTSSARAGRRRRARSTPRSTCWRRARWEASSTTRPCRGCAAGSSPARPTTSWPTTGSPTSSPTGRSCGRRTSWSMRAASSTSSRSSTSTARRTPAGACAGSPPRSARSSTMPSGCRSPRWPPPASWPARACAA